MRERSNIRRMAGYVPGARPTQPAIRLNTNENPLEPSPAAIAAIADITPTMLQRYPDPRAAALCKAIAGYHALSPDQVLATNGSDELLRLAVTTFADPGKAIGILDPGYDLYGVLSAIQDCPLARVSLDDNWLPPEDAATCWNEAGARLVLIANPQAPSGRLLPREWLLRVAAGLDGVLLVDEAYVDFVDPALQYGLTEEIGRVPNLILSRTLSKGHALAGLRLGYGLGPADLIAPMKDKVRDSYNVDAIAQHVACAALVDTGQAKKSWDLVRAERQRLAGALGVLGIETLPSQANFLLARIPSVFGGAQELHDALAARRIYVRRLTAPRLAPFLRISVGAPEENNALIAAIESLLPQSGQST